MLNFLKGKKTYFVAALTIIYAATALVLGKIDGNTAVELVSGALAFAAIRNGITK